MLLIAMIAVAAFSIVQTPAQVIDWTRCTDCHQEPEESLPSLSMLRPWGWASQPRNDCLECHDPAALTEPQSSWVHPVRPVAAHVPCTSCHPAVPHDATAPPPPPTGDYKAEGCYGCHRTIEAQRHFLSRHGEARLRCRSCHPPHEPLSAALPQAFIPVGSRNAWRASYDWWLSNEMCLDCHPPAGVLLALDTGFVTLNTHNYHDLHVSRGAILCLECHTPHGSMRHALLRTDLLTGETLGYSQNPDGGTCSVICHAVEHTGWTYTNCVY